MMPRQIRKNVLLSIVRLAFCLELLGMLPGANAQSAGLTVGSASGMPGSTVRIPVQFNSGTASVSTLQFDLLFPSSLAYITTSTGAAASAAGKSASGNALLDGVRIVVFGFNQDVLDSGVIAEIQLSISATVGAGSIPLTVREIVASDPDAKGVPVSSTAGNVTVLGPADGTPPVISSVLNSTPTSTSTIISWITDEASSTQVDYGTSNSYGKSTVMVSTPVTLHSQALSGLTAGTLYHYRVKSRDAAGNLATSGDYTFATSVASDVTAPKIGAISSSPGRTSATIAWTTNEASDAQVEYGVSSAYGHSTAVNGALLTSHSQNVSGLTANTQYHYRVKSKDAAGNLAISGDNMFTTSAEPDTKAPAISSVSSSGLTSSEATITWITDEASDTQVEYGTSAGYGSSTTLKSTLVKSHSQALSGLAPNTLYHYRVKSRDAVGNLALSNDYTLTTREKSSSLQISDVAVSDITGRGATISWTTDKAANSAVEYWNTGIDGRSASLESLVTRHTVVLKGLQKLTLYRFRAKSKDPEGNEAVSAVLNFTTTDSESYSFALPRFALMSGGAGDSGKTAAGRAESIMGIALANLDAEPASLEFTAIESDGFYTRGSFIHNPRFYELEPGAQLPIHDSTIFGDGLAVTNSDGWIRLDTNTQGIDGLFMIFDSDLNYMDGANIANDTLADLIFTEIQPNGHNRLNIANKNVEDVSVTLKLMGADGAVCSSESRVIAKNGALTADLFNDLFAGFEAKAADYVRVSADKGVQSFQVLQHAKGDISMLAGQDAAAGNTVLYSPQYVIGGRYRTGLSVVNLDSRKGTVQFKFFGEDGKQIGTTRSVEIPANGKFFISNQAFFENLDSDKMTSGYVEIVSDGVRLAGSTVFGDINRETFASALALISELKTSVLFSHVASNDLFFTGIAILNPNSSVARVTLELLDASGKAVDETVLLIPAGNKRARLLPQYFGSLKGKDQTSGYVRLTSDLPVASFSLFGTHNLSVLSAIPPKPIE